MKATYRLMGVTALSFVIATAASAQTSSSGSSGTSGSSSSSSSGAGSSGKHNTAKSTVKGADKSFVEAAAKSGMEEIAVSRVALEKATNAQVKEFAQMMVSDHSGANMELTALAAAKGVTLPKEPSTDTWTKKGAKGFDSDYMAKMVSDHKDTVKLFEKEAKSGNDPELMAFASKTLPKLQAHLAKAEEIKKSVK